MHPIEIVNATKRFKALVAVDDLSLTVPQGAIYGFIGPNGSGKTTTLRMILRILHPDSGEIRVLGADALSAANDQIGYLPEERGLYKNMKVIDLLEFFGALKGLRHGRSEAQRWLDELGLGQWAKKKVQALSKGMAQKVQFIAAVIANPKLLILDEPFSGLDPVNAEVIKRAVLGLRDRGTTILFSTHDMEVAEKMCDYICMIYKGKKVIDGTLEAIQDTYGQDVIRLRLEGNSGVVQRLSQLPSVQHVNDFGRMQELRLEKGADTQNLLAGLMQIGPVRHFELSRPSLRDIFVRIASPVAEEASHA